MVEKVLTETTFIHGRLAYAGETVDIDANDPSGYAPAPSTPIGQLTVEQLQAALARAQSKEAKEQSAFSPNVADPSDAPAGVQAMHIADIAPRGPGTTAPQGVPSGGHQTVGGNFVFPNAGVDTPTEIALADTAEGHTVADALPTINPPDLDGDGGPGGSLTKAEIVDALQDRAKTTGEKVDASKTKGELQTQLSNPPAPE